MKKILVSIFLLSFSSIGFSQTNRTAYVDIYHILEKSPEYTEATLELEKRAKDWKTQINNKKTEVKTMKDALATERALLTQQLIDEKEDEIQMVQSELSTLEHEKFGIEGDYFKQKENIYKPLLDQIHTISNDIATKKRLDVVLVKSEENTMIYANKRNDITDLVIREMERTRTRSKMSKKEIAALEIQDKIEESKERQLSKRDMLKERQRDLESGKYNESDELDNNSKAPTNTNETDIERRLREKQEQIAAVKQKQQEIREAQLKKVEEQKLAIKKKQEEQKLARENALQAALDKKNNQAQKTSADNNSKKELTPKQQEMLAQRQQKIKEAKEKRDLILAERKQAMENRKKEAEEARNKRLKDIQEAKENRLKEIENLKNNK